MKKYLLDLRLSAVERLNDKYYLLKLFGETPLPDINPGQFVEVRVDGSASTFLRRPISVHFVDYEKNELWLLVAAVGDGTRTLINLNPGTLINCLFPLGNGFSMEDIGGKNILLIGGGVGIAPLLYYGKLIKEAGGSPTFLMGYRTKEDIIETELFSRYGNVFITTEDGSFGEKGYVTQHSLLTKEKFDFIASCGPKPMMVSVAKFARKTEIPCEVSLENMMACGLGACLCCVEKTIKGNLCVCKDGPVFNVNQLLW